jgi:hypothetical protein
LKLLPFSSAITQLIHANTAKMIRTYTKTILPFLKAHGSHTEQAFDIPSIKVMPTETTLLNVSLKDLEEIGLVELTVTIKKLSTMEHQDVHIDPVCYDVEKLIYSYLQDTFTVTVLMDFRNNFPFWGPKMKLSKVSKDIYNLDSVINRFNCDLQADWSPALGFDKTLLLFLSRILEATNYV